MSGSSNPSSKPPLPANRPRFPTGTVIGGKKVSNQYMSNAVVNAAREGMVSKDQLDATEQKLEAAEQKIQQQQQEIDQANQDIENQKREIDQVQADVLNQQQSARPSRLQRIGSTIARGARIAGALGPMGMIRSINRSAETNTSLFNFAGADAQNVASVRAGGMGFGGSQGGYALSPRAERAIITTSTDTAAVRVSIGRLERVVSGIAAKMEASESPTSSVKPTKSEEGGGGGGIMGLIGSLFGGLGNLFGGGGGAAGLGALLKRSISAIARAIFTKIPYIGPLILVALNIEGAMEEYEKNGLGAAITDLLSGIGSDLTFGLIDKDTIKEFINKGIEKVSEWWNTAKDTLMGVVDSVIGGLQNFFGSIGNFFRRTVDDFNTARDRVREASERSEQDRRRALQNMQPSPSGSPGQAGARGVAESYNISSRELAGIQDIFETPEAGETPEQKAERERLDAILRNNERTGVGGNVEITPEIANYINRRRMVDNEAQYADLLNSDPADAFSRESTANTTTSPPAAERVQQQPQRPSEERVPITQTNRRNRAELVNQIEAVASSRGVTARAGIISDGRVVAIEPVSGRRIDITEMAPIGEEGAAQMAPGEPDLRSQSIATGANEPSVVVVQQPAPMSQQTAPPAIPAQGSSRGAATGRAPAPATHPERPNDVGSAAMSGSR